MVSLKSLQGFPVIPTGFLCNLYRGFPEICTGIPCNPYRGFQCNLNRGFPVICTGGSLFSVQGFVICFCKKKFAQSGIWTHNFLPNITVASLHRYQPTVICLSLIWPISNKNFFVWIKFSIHENVESNKKFFQLKKNNFHDIKYFKRIIDIKIIF